MNSQDRQAIEGLFDRIEDVARNAAPRDREAEQVIQDRLNSYPPAPYYMAQTILIQEEALRQAQERIEALERKTSQSGGLMGSLFGGGGGERSPSADRARGPWGSAPSRRDEEPARYGQGFGQGQGRGGGFLAGAAQTALGVTGGVLLGSALSGMLMGGAQAEEYGADDAGADAGEAGDAGDMGGDDFDIGGEF